MRSLPVGTERARERRLKVKITTKLVRSIRTVLRGVRESDHGPMALLLFAVLVPMVCLLWFMDAAMRNERLATRQKLVELYRVQLASSQSRLEQHWRDAASALDRLAGTNPAPVAFEQCVRSGLVDGVVILDAQGGVSYPNRPVANPVDIGEAELKWQEAARLEHLHKHLDAAERYDALAREIPDDNAAARAFQAEVRCLAQAGQTGVAVQRVQDAFSGERFRRARDPQGRLIAGNVELLALELITNRASPVFQFIARRLSGRLTEYGNPMLAAPQRRFLMKELQALAPAHSRFPTLAAEQLAAEFAEFRADGSGNPGLKRSPLPGIWQIHTPNQRVLALLRTETLLAAAQQVLAREKYTPDVTVGLVPPDLDAASAFVTLPAGGQLPGWRLAISSRDGAFPDASAGRQNIIHVWTAVLVIAVMGVLTVFALRILRRQMALARLKNDLAATVSHELKTPLASMQVLVETLLDSEKLDEVKTREYLQLIARENERLARLIENFLTFSRMERKKYGFHFSPSPAGRIVEAAIQSVRGRFEAPGCRLEVRIADDLPPILADPDAMAAALINLVDNAYKFTETEKHIVVSARAEHGSVLFSVEDNGIGIAPGDRVEIFRPFHQLDERLSRRGGGCGLGLSIVRFITAAHLGEVVVNSQPGCGSTFTISIPAFSSTDTMRREAVS
jgi:signal transduction histidine kinase